MIPSNCYGSTEELERVILQPEGSGPGAHDKCLEALERVNSSVGDAALPKPLDRKG